MLRELWSRLTRTSVENAVEREIVRERMSPGDRHLVTDPIDITRVDTAYGGAYAEPPGLRAEDDDDVPEL